MRFLARSLVGLLIAALTLGLAGYGAWRVHVAMLPEEGEGDAPARAERVHAVQIGILEATQLRPTVTAYGEVRS
ncbi:MAG: secretion protein HlyD, partial [Pseudomonadota bacterium]